MKKQFLLPALFTFIFSLNLTTTILAQTPAPHQGYWVTETNLKQKNKTTVRFYNAQHQLVHEQFIVGTRVNIKNPKTVKALNAKLYEVMDKPLVAKE